MSTTAISTTPGSDSDSDAHKTLVHGLELALKNNAAGDSAALVSFLQQAGITPPPSKHSASASAPALAPASTSTSTSASASVGGVRSLVLSDINTPLTVITAKTTTPDVAFYDDDDDDDENTIGATSYRHFIIYF